MLRWYARRVGMAAAVLGSVALAACDDDNQGPNQGPLAVEMAPDDSGDDQSGTVSQRLPDELRVVVTRGDEPAQDIEVRWVTEGGGSFNPSTARTDEDGVATTLWTLGPGVGGQTATAQVTDADGSPITFSATAEAAAPPPPPGGGPPVAVQGRDR